MIDSCSCGSSFAVVILLSRIRELHHGILVHCSSQFGAYVSRRHRALALMSLTVIALQHLYHSLSSRFGANFSVILSATAMLPLLPVIYIQPMWKI